METGIAKRAIHRMDNYVLRLIHRTPRMNIMVLATRSSLFKSLKKRAPVNELELCGGKANGLVVPVLNWISMNAMGRTIEGLAHVLYDSFVKQIVDFGSLRARLFGT